jgi:ribosomal protein L7/L12
LACKPTRSPDEEAAAVSLRRGPEGGVLSNPKTPLPEPVLQALADGNVIEAIKLLRATGLGLKEAKDVIDIHQMGGDVPPSFDSTMPAGTLAPNVIDAVRRGNKIDAIRLLRDQTGMGLQEAKDTIEAYALAHPAQANASPGELPKGGSGSLRWIAILAVVAIVGYFLLRRFG